MYSLPILELLQDSCDPPATPESFEELEIELGVRFPKEYTDFLLQFNGGYFHRLVSCYLPQPTKWIDEILVNCFIGDPSDRGLGNSLAVNAGYFEGRIPDDCLAVADCGCSDLVLLQVAGAASDIGKIWYWDRADECEGNNIHSLADSFPEFLSMLLPSVLHWDAERERIPIFLAVERGQAPTVENFLTDGGDVETRNADGLTLLAAAARYCWPKIVRLLLQHSADPNARDHLGRTPLHHAAKHSLDSVKLLLSAGADATARDRSGASVLAEWWYRADQIFRAHGAKQ